MSRTLVLAIIVLAASVQAEDLKTPPELAKKINAGIAQLETKEYEPFLKSYMNPKDFEKATEAKNRDLAAFAKKFGETKAASLLAVLKYVKGKAPNSTEEEGKIVVFSLTDSKIEGAKERIRFSKVGDEWYIMNN